MSAVDGSGHQSSRAQLSAACAQLLQDLLADDEYADVSFRVAGETISAHKNIVCQMSDVFSVMFKPGMQEGNSSIADIKHCEPDVFRAFKKFVYLQALDFEELMQMGRGVLPLVYQYQLKTKDIFVGLLLKPREDQPTSGSIFDFIEQVEEAVVFGDEVELLVSANREDDSLQKLQDAFHDWIIARMREDKAVFDMVDGRDGLRRAIMQRMLQVYEVQASEGEQAAAPQTP